MVFLKTFLIKKNGSGKSKELEGKIITRKPKDLPADQLSLLIKLTNSTRRANIFQSFSDNLKAKMGVGTRVKEKGAFRSQVPRVLLQINPGVDRQLAAQIQLMNKLREKSNRSGDFKRHR